MTDIKLATGATEADIIRALAQLPDGGTVILPAGETIPIRQGINVDVAARDITIDLNGATLKQEANVPVITARGTHPGLQPVELGERGNGNTTVTFETVPQGVAVGGWVKVVADDVLPGDHLDAADPTRVGQALQVTAIEGNTVVLAGTLVDQEVYQTNIRATSYQSGEFVLKNGDIVGEQSYSTWTSPLVQVRSAVEPKFEELEIRNGNSMGISVVDSVNAQVTDYTVRDLMDITGTFGTGVHSHSSTGTTVTGLYAENVRHAADSNSIGIPAGHWDASRFGGDIGMVVQDSVAYNTSNFAWSWHSESINGVFENVWAFDSYGFMMARGRGGTMVDSGGANNERGLVLYEWGDNDARDMTFDNVTLKETLHYSTISINDPRDNHFVDSWFEAYGASAPVAPEVADYTNTVYVRADANENDAVDGTAAADNILGGKGNDVLSGNGGDDMIWGGGAVDVLTGGEGSDRFVFNDLAEGGDIVTDFAPGTFGDRIDLATLSARLGWDGSPSTLMQDGYIRFAQEGENTLVEVDPDGGADAFQTLAILQGVDAGRMGPINLITELAKRSDPEPQPDIVGTEGGDTLVGTEAADLITAKGGNDQVDGLGGDDIIWAGAGEDRVQGGEGFDTLYGEDGHDELDGNGGNDAVFGGAGNDLLRGGDGVDLVHGGEGVDRLYGGADADTLMGGEGDDRLYAEDGDDVLIGGPGADTLSGSIGYDTASYATAAAGVVANLADASVNTGEAAGDYFSSIEHLTGSAYDDVLTGTAIANTLAGGDGNDALYGGDRGDRLDGGNGDDLLDGGAGADVLTGGRGSDTFVIKAIGDGGDTITDFRTGTDRVGLSSAFGDENSFALVTPESFDPGSPLAVAIYNQANGQLRWDEDGGGSRPAVTLATLSGAPALTADDFVFV